MIPLIDITQDGIKTLKPKSTTLVIKIDNATHKITNSLRDQYTIGCSFANTVSKVERLSLSLQKSMVTSFTSFALFTSFRKVDFPDPQFPLRKYYMTPVSSDRQEWVVRN